MKALALALLVLSGTALAATDVPPGQKDRYETLIHELRCLVCQNQSLAESNAPLAEDLREQVRGQIAAGRSDDEIIDYLTARYGDFVLYRPRVKPLTWLLWFGPVLVLVGAAAAATWFLRRGEKLEEPPADAATMKRLLEDDQP